jgi:hypothetical protein
MVESAQTLHDGFFAWIIFISGTGCSLAAGARC